MDALAKMGLLVRDDPPRVIDFNARQWGEAQNGWALSVEIIQGRDPGDLPSLGVVIRNVAAVPQTLVVPGWLHFFKLEVRDANGIQLPMAPFGRTALDPSRRRERIEAEIAPGGGTETQIPLGSFFQLKGRSGLRATAQATVAPGVTLLSNEAKI